MLSSMACPAVQYLFTLSHKWHDFGGGGVVTEHKLCVLAFSLWIISHSKKKWAKYDHKCVFVFKYSIKFHDNLFSGRWVVPCSWADVQTDDKA